MEIIFSTMRIEYSFCLKPFTGFGIDAKTDVFVEVESIDDLQECRKRGLLDNPQLLILGGGSNLLFCDDFSGVTLHPKLKGISIIEKSETHVIVEAQAGEIWDDLVAFTVDRGFYGIENLSFIPGNVGACPVQNIGAYGVEVQSSIEKVAAFELQSGEIHYFTNEECQFAYRDSVFKNELKDKYCIVSVQFRLSLIPQLHVDYKDVQVFLKNDVEISIQKVRNAIIAIRKAKLPDPAIVGNAGSFFKNPVVSNEKAESLNVHFPSIVMYTLADGSAKLAAGWLIEKAGWKGFRKGDAGVHPTQALVLVNYGNATGNEIRDLANEIQESVFMMFGVKIVPEVKMIV